MKQTIIRNLLIFTLLFSIFAFSANAIAVTLNSCDANSKGLLDSTNVTGSWCINATFSALPTGGDSGTNAGGTNITQCVFSVTGTKQSFTIGTNSNAFVNLSSVTEGSNASAFTWDTTAFKDQNLTIVTVTCTVNVTGNTITDTASNVIVDNTVLPATYAGETPRDGATIDNDFVLLETRVDSTVVGCILRINKTTDSIGTNEVFAPKRDKCTTEDVVSTKSLADGVTYSYLLEWDDGYNVTQLPVRTFTTNIRSATPLTPAERGVPQAITDTSGIIIVIILAIVLIGGGGWWWMKNRD